jgi:hypothetical protein
MQTINADRRTVNRRACRAGGRRQHDPAASPAISPTCPCCLKDGTAVTAGESEDGWWFVCLDCDHLWDQRQRETALVLSTQYRRSAMISWMSGITWFQ